MLFLLKLSRDLVQKKKKKNVQDCNNEIKFYFSSVFFIFWVYVLIWSAQNNKNCTVLKTIFWIKIKNGKLYFQKKSHVVHLNFL